MCRQGWRCRGTALILLFLIFLLGTAGCSPKRVSQGTAIHAAPVVEAAVQPPPTLPQSEPAAEEISQELPPDLLPDPQFRGKSGLATPGATANNLRLGLKAATLAQQQIGKPYQWGASGPDRFDCSGLVQFVFGNLGVSLPRVSHRQAQVGQKVGRSDLQPGDLLFFSVHGGRIDHVGIFIGDQNFVHAPRRKYPVRTDSLDNAWWRRRLRLAKRLE